MNRHPWLCSPWLSYPHNMSTNNRHIHLSGVSLVLVKIEGSSTRRMGCFSFLYGFVLILMKPVLICTFALLWDIALVITFPYFGDNGIQPHRGHITRKTSR